MNASHEAAPALFAANPLPMWIVDETGHEVLDANEAALRRYGLRREDALALDPAELVRVDLRSRFRAWIAAGEPVPTDDFDQRTADGGTFPAELRVNRLRWNGRAARLVVVRDVGARQRVEERLRQSQKMEAVGRLAGSIAHDFNNLLTAIGGYAHLLLVSLPEDDPRREDAKQIRRAVDSGAALTRQLLGFSRRQFVQPETVDLNDAVNGMRPLLERLLGERVTLVLGLGPRAGTVRIDRGQLEQVLLNLALNGRDAMPNGGRLLVETALVELDRQYAAARGDETVPGRYAMLAVSDEGEGLSEEARHHLFEPFFTTKPRGHGTGLGLATVYGIVRQAGGHIDVFSRPDFATTFRVYLPSLAAPRPQPPAERPAPTPAEARPGLRGSVLVVEDEPVVRAVLVEVLRRAGLTVAEAGDGAEALARLDEGPLPDLVLTDVRMPRLSGTELARAARARWPDLRLLFVSGHTGSETADEVTAIGGRLIGKPFTTHDLLAAVTEALDGGRNGGRNGASHAPPAGPDADASAAPEQRERRGGTPAREPRAGA